MPAAADVGVNKSMHAGTLLGDCPQLCVTAIKPDSKKICESESVATGAAGR
jgi:hypothetical protein